ncbi:response regulator transcription factor [Streptomyces sp. NPDC019443]|uniref:response regulator transcription factor n=1 Tax=Streptomyces sp. NPDC019443 TaxID=3365061 RepID=UPI00378A3F98
MSPPVASRLLRRFRAPDLELSTREIEILERVAEGRANREISRALFIGEATAKTHLAHIYEKLGVDNRTAAVRASVAMSRAPGMSRTPDSGHCSVQPHGGGASPA